MRDGDGSDEWFAAGDAGLADFWRVYQASYDVIHDATMKVARAHAEFAPMVNAMTPEQMRAQSEQSRERLRAAVESGAWSSYAAELRQQGATYAHMGLGFASWYDLVGAFKHEMVRLLVDAYQSAPPRLTGAICALHTFVDRAMVIIAEAYLAAKEELVAEQRALVAGHEERYRMLFDNGPVPMWVYDRDTQRFLAVNRAASEHYGYSEEEFLGMTIEQIRFVEDLPKLHAESARDKADTGRIELGEWRHRKKDGTPIYVDLRLQNFIFLGRRAHLVVATDVTERKQAASALTQSEERYRSLVAATSSIVFTADAGGGFAPPQPSWQAFTGQDAEAYRARGWLAAVHADDRARVGAAWQRACDTRSGFAAEGRLYHAKSGQHRYFTARAVPLFDDGGAVREWIGTVTDIDEQKRSEQPGRFFKLSLDLLCIAGTDGYFKRLNPAFSVLGYSEEELLGRPFIDFVHPDDVPATLAEVEKLTRGEPTIQFENRYRCKDGSYRHLMWASATDATGWIYAAARDITERKRTEEERAELTRILQHQNEELSRASRAKSDFLAMMSHELRTPLNSIIGFSEVLIDGKFGGLNDKQRRYLQNVLQSGRHLLGLINDLLDLSKIEAGRLEVSHEPCAARLLAAEAIVTLQPLADARKLEVSLTPTGDVALPPVSADAARFKQVLYNLLSNAIKFTPPGGRIHIACTPLPDVGRLRVAVRDTGPGISAADIERLYTPFTQLGNTSERGGTGLGLSLTKQLVELMGGAINVESKLGAGTTFFVDLPLYGAATEPSAREPAGRTDSPLVLIVDDDAAARELLILALQGGGFRTLAVGSGDEAVAQARLHRPDVITLDVFLPTIDGWDVLRLLKSDRDTTDIPVVIVSISSDRRKAFSLGAHEHLVKPVSRETLLDALGRRSFTTKVKTTAVHLLAIDDDPRQLELFRAALEPQGFRVRTASSGQAGLEAAATGPVDLILLDLVMPDLSGIEVVARLRADERTRGVPILLVTAHELSASERARLNGDVEAIVSKGSMRVEDLLAEIKRVLRRDGRR